MTSSRGCHEFRPNSRISPRGKDFNPVSVFREYLLKTYADSPDAVGDFVSKSYVFVRIKQRFWRGYRKAKGVGLQLEGVESKDKIADAMTQPSWKLAPKELVSEFQNFSTSVEQAVSRWAISPRDDDENEERAVAAVLVGGGRYMVDVAVWPQLQDFLSSVQTKWSEAADHWCTEDGHAKLHDHVKSQYGDEVYDRISKLIPERNSMRSRFGLSVRTAPVKIVEEGSTSDASKQGRRDEVVDLLELAVKTPREEAAEVWEEVGNRLVEFDGERWSAKKRYVERDGTSKETNRVVQVRTVQMVNTTAKALSRGERYLDPVTKSFRDKIVKEFPADAGSAKDVAKLLASNDQVAVQLGCLLIEAAKACRDEAAMCEGLSAAVAVGVQ